MHVAIVVDVIVLGKETVLQRDVVFVVVMRMMMMVTRGRLRIVRGHHRIGQHIDEVLR